MQIEFTHDFELGTEPPTEFRLLKMGLNETTKGVINLTPAALEAVLAKVKADGRDKDRLSFDFNHSMVRSDVSPQDQISAGSFSVEGRKDGLWILNAKWTEDAFAAIAARKWRFFSPVLMLNTKTREPTQLVNVALTNLPATKDQTPLVASQEVGSTDQLQKESQLDETIIKLFGALGVQDAAGAEAQYVQLTAENVALKEASGTLTAENVELKADIAGRDEKEEAVKLAALIVKLNGDGKLQPALNKWAATQTFSQLEAYGKDAPASKVTEKVVEASEEGSTLILSEVEQNLCRAMDLSEESYVEARKAGL